VVLFLVVVALFSLSAGIASDDCAGMTFVVSPFRLFKAFGSTNQLSSIGSTDQVVDEAAKLLLTSGSGSAAKDEHTAMQSHQSTQAAGVKTRDIQRLNRSTPGDDVVVVDIGGSGIRGGSSSGETRMSVSDKAHLKQFSIWGYAATIVTVSVAYEIFGMRR